MGLGSVNLSGGDRRRQQCEKIANQSNNNRELLYSLAKERQKRKLEKANPRIVKPQVDVKGEQAVMKKAKGSKWNPFKIFKHKNKQKGEYKALKEADDEDLNEISIDTDDIRNIELRSLELTNFFRKTKGMQELIWDEELHKIASVHSQNMAEGKVQICHEGFENRMSKLPFQVRAFNENIACTCENADPAGETFNEWLNSPSY